MATGQVERFVLLSLVLGCAKPAPPPPAPAPVAVEASAPAPILHLSDEAALAVTGTQLLVAQNALKDPDAPHVEAAMRAAYDRMRADEASGALRGDLDRMWLEPKRAELGVVFLHGYGGRFALPCWQVARATGAVVACPSIGADGAWWTADREALARKTVDALRADGAKKVLLVGLSNGGIGATRIAAKLKIDGVIAISGADPAAPSPGVPALAVHGKTDAMAAASSAKTWAAKARGTWVELDAGHFVMLRRAGETEAALRDWVAGLR